MEAELGLVDVGGARDEAGICVPVVSPCGGGGVFPVWAAMAAEGKAGIPPWCIRLLPLYGFAKLFPWIGVRIRRLHDTGFSGGFWFLYVVPCGGLVLAGWLLLHPGKRGPNAYGLDPRMPVSSWRGLGSLPQAG